MPSVFPKAEIHFWSTIPEHFTLPQSHNNDMASKVCLQGHNYSYWEQAWLNPFSRVHKSNTNLPLCSNNVTDFLSSRTQWLTWRPFAPLLFKSQSLCCLESPQITQKWFYTKLPEQKSLIFNLPLTKKFRWSSLHCKAAFAKSCSGQPLFTPSAFGVA